MHTIRGVRRQTSRTRSAMGFWGTLPLLSSTRVVAGSSTGPMEANWLGPALLISEEAAIYIVERRLTMSQAVVLFGVSSDLITMTLSVTGARRRVERRAAYPARARQ
jgi:hypothetical protein